MRTNSVKFENVRVKYITGRCNDTSLRIRAKKLLSEKKIDSISTFSHFAYESLSQINQNPYWLYKVPHTSVNDVNRNSEMA